jgi:hypothetical protein
MSTKANFLLTVSRALLLHGSFCRHDGESTFRCIGGKRTTPCVPCPHMELVDLNAQALYLQVNSIEHSTSKNCATGAHDYINLCILHSLPLDPTPTTLSCYIAYSSQFINSGPKYLTGMWHFLKDLYPDFDANCAHPLVSSTIRGPKKMWADPVERKLPLCLAHLQSFLNVQEPITTSFLLLF